jgi:hypothetical protein
VKKSLPLEDPRWVPLTRALGERADQIDSRHFAARDLIRKLRKERIRSMCRRRCTEVPHGPPAAECTLLSKVFWRDHELSADNELFPVYPLSEKPTPIVYLRNVDFFVWAPDFKKIFRPVAAPIEPSQPASSELTATLKRLPAELAAALKLPSEADATPGKTGKTQRKQRQIAQAIMDRRYPHAAPGTATVVRTIAEEWKAESLARKMDPTSINPPGWHTVNRMLGRE